MIIYRRFRCSDCIWHGDENCDGEKTCMYFSPIPSVEDEYLDEIIRINKIRYLTDWFKYFDEEEA